MAEMSYDYDHGRVTLTFKAAEHFAASSAAARWLKDRGFAIGPMQHPEPRGVVFGAVTIGKWRTLAPLEREALHGEVTGDALTGPIFVTIFAGAPEDAREAIVSMPAEVASTKTRLLDRALDIGAALVIALCFGSLGYVVFYPILDLPRHPSIGKIELRVLPANLEARR